jgi:hypothetical protein
MMAKSLHGLKSMNVLVERIKPEIEWLGITQRQIKSETESRLQKSGIRLMPQGPYLYIRVTAFLHDVNIVYEIAASFNRMVTLERDPTISVSAATWETAYVGIVEQGNMGKIRMTIDDVVKEFINDHLAANAK